MSVQRKSNVVVLMSTYNGEQYLGAQLDSIIGQKHKCDILIRDDGSKDSTIQILEEYQKRNDNIKIISGHNMGYVGSYFELMKQAEEYCYYAFSDQDDVWFEDKLEKAIEELEKLDEQKPCLYSSCSLLVNDQMEGKYTTQIDRKGINYYNIIIQNIMPGHTQVANRKLIEEVLANQPQLKQIFVHDYWLSLVAITFGEFYFDNCYHTYYRQHENNSLGYGQGKFAWISERINHVKDGAAKNITRQNQEFLRIYGNKLKDREKQEIALLLGSQRNFLTRLSYLFRCRAYRQKRSETALFYILYLFGGYKI